MIYLLARTHSRHEFATADAINDLGALAVVPRDRVTPKAKPGKPTEPETRPLLSRLLFIACTETQWHQFQTKRLRWGGKILPPIHREFELTSHHWAECQAFMDHAETEYQYRMELEAQGKNVRNMRPGDMMRIVNTNILDGQLHDQLAKFVRLERGKVLVETGVMFMGKPVTARLDPGDVMGVAAE